MAAPVQAQVDQSGTPSGGVPPTSIHGAPKPFERRTYKRMFQHYVTNANTSFVPVARYTGNNETHPIDHTTSAKFKKGWLYIPYEKLNAAMTQGDRDALLINSTKYRVVEQGFSIKKIQVMQQNVTATAAATTTVRNSFVQAPHIFVHKDSDDLLYEHTFVDYGTGVNDTAPVWRSIAPNNDMKSMYGTFDIALDPTTPTPVATLQEVSFYLPINAGANPNPIDPDGFEIERGPECIMLNSGDKYSYSWQNNNPNTWHSSNGIQAGGSEVNIQLQIINNTVDLYSQAATDVGINIRDKPKMHLIRVPPLYDAIGPMYLNIELIIEYHLTIEYQPASGYLFSRFANTTGALLGLYIDSAVDDARAFLPLNRRAVVQGTSISDFANTVRNPYDIYNDQPLTAGGRKRKWAHGVQPLASNGSSLSQMEQPKGSQMETPSQ